MSTDTLSISIHGASKFWESLELSDDCDEAVPSVKFVTTIWDCVLKGLPLPQIVFWESWDGITRRNLVVRGSNVVAAVLGKNLYSPKFGPYDRKPVPLVKVVGGKVVPTDSWEESLQWYTSRQSESAMSDNFRLIIREFLYGQGYTSDTSIIFMRLDNVTCEDVRVWKKMQRGLR